MICSASSGLLFISFVWLLLSWLFFDQCDWKWMISCLEQDFHMGRGFLAGCSCYKDREFILTMFMYKSSVTHIFIFVICLMLKNRNWEGEDKIQNMGIVKMLNGVCSVIASHLHRSITEAQWIRRLYCNKSPIPLKMGSWLYLFSELETHRQELHILVSSTVTLCCTFLVDKKHHLYLQHKNEHMFHSSVNRKVFYHI